jgi:hypothetical protein
VAPWQSLGGRGGSLAAIGSMLGLQRTHGNAYVQRLVQRCGGKSCTCSPEEHAAAAGTIARNEEAALETEVAPLPPVQGKGVPHDAIAHAGGRPRSLRIQGKTNVHYNGGAFHTENVVAERGEGCRSCRGPNCVHVTGDVVIDYAVTTSVTLPQIPRGLTACQRERVQDAIDGDLRPHEQQHVDAFHTYDGSTTLSFDRTLCRNGFNAMIGNLVHTDEQPRRASAQSASDALDPHVVQIDLNCTDAAAAAP